jgi:uncharacterized RDD family membrane protein YckC
MTHQNEQSKETTEFKSAEKLYEDNVSLCETHNLGSGSVDEACSQRSAEFDPAPNIANVETLRCTSGAEGSIRPAGNSMTEMDASQTKTDKVATMLQRVWSITLDFCIFGSISLVCLGIFAAGFIGKALAAPDSNSFFWQTVLEDSMIFGLIGYLVACGGWMLITVCFESSKKQGTPGMILAGIKSVTKSGARLNFWHASWRLWSEQFCIGLTWQVSLIFTAILLYLIKVPPSDIAGTFHWALLAIIMALAGMLCLYQPTFNTRRQSLLDVVARKRVITRDYTHRIKTSRISSFARACLYFFVPYLSGSIYYFFVPAYEVPFLNHFLCRLFLIGFICFHLLGVPFAFLARSFKHWSILWLAYIVPLTLFTAFSSALFLKKSITPEIMATHSFVFILLVLAFVVSSPNLRQNWKSVIGVLQKKLLNSVKFTG